MTSDSWLAQLWSWLASVSGSVEEWLLAHVDSIWVYFATYGLSFTDAIFPVVPSESVVIALSTTWAATGEPILLWVWLAAALGAWTGDQVAFSVGRRVNLRRVPLLRSKRGQSMLEWASHSLEKRGTSFIIAARFIPGGRVTVNLSAGSLGYPRPRFVGVAAIAAVIWATYSVLLGVMAGSLFGDNLLISITVGVVGGIALGYLVDFVLSRLGFSQPHMSVNKDS